MREKIEKKLKQRKEELQQKIDLYNQLEEQQRELIKEIVLLQGKIQQLEELLKSEDEGEKEEGRWKEEGDR